MLEKLSYNRDNALRFIFSGFMLPYVEDLDIGYIPMRERIIINATAVQQPIAGESVQAIPTSTATTIASEAEINKPTKTWDDILAAASEIDSGVQSGALAFNDLTLDKKLTLKVAAKIKETRQKANEQTDEEEEIANTSMPPSSPLLDTVTRLARSSSSSLIYGVSTMGSTLGAISPMTTLFKIRSAMIDLATGVDNEKLTSDKLIEIKKFLESCKQLLDKDHLTNSSINYTSNQLQTLILGTEDELAKIRKRHNKGDSGRSEAILRMYGLMLNWFAEIQVQESLNIVNTYDPQISELIQKDPEMHTFELLSMKLMSDLFRIALIIKVDALSKEQNLIANRIISDTADVEITNEIFKQIKCFGIQKDLKDAQRDRVDSLLTVVKSISFVVEQQNPGPLLQEIFEELKTYNGKLEDLIPKRTASLQTRGFTF